MSSSSNAPRASPDAAGNQNTFLLHQVSSRQNVLQLVTFLKSIAQRGEMAVLIDARDASGIYPNAATPIAAIIQHYRNKGFDVRILEKPDSFFAHTRIRNPLTASPMNLATPDSQLNVVWQYDRETSAHLADSVVAELSRKLEFGAGVLAALNWCLYEVLDNVFEHAGSSAGYFMAQIHRNSQQLSICVADSGIGVHRSFYLGGFYRPKTAFDALTLAIREGVSATGDRRGNGLFGLKGVVEKNGGRLSLLSGRAYLKITPSGFEAKI